MCVYIWYMYMYVCAVHEQVDVLIIILWNTTALDDDTEHDRNVKAVQFIALAGSKRLECKAKHIIS